MQKRAGFETLIGSGTMCTGPGGCEAGEACVDPDNDGTFFRCMGGGGTEADPYYIEEYLWEMGAFDLELLPGTFDFNDFDFSTHELYLTHATTNDMQFN